MVYPPNMTRILAERSGEENLDEPRGLLDPMHAATDRDDVRVVVLPCEPGGFITPRKCGPDTLHLVRRDLFTVSRAADDDGKAPGVGSHTARGEKTIRGIVIAVDILRGTAIHRVVAEARQMRKQMSLQLETGMVRGEVNAHERSLWAPSCPEPGPVPTWPWLPMKRQAGR